MTFDIFCNAHNAPGKVSEDLPKTWIYSSLCIRLYSCTLTLYLIPYTVYSTSGSCINNWGFPFFMVGCCT